MMEMKSSLFFLFLTISFWSSAQEIKKSNYYLPKKNWVKTKPFITFCGKEGGLILLDSISTESIISIKDPCSFVSLSIYFGGSGFANPQLASFGVSDKENIKFFKLSPLEEVIKRVKSQTKIVLTNIKVKKDKIIYDSPDVTYIVK